MLRLIIPETVKGRLRLYSVLMVGVPLVFAALVLIVFVKSAITSSGKLTLVEQVSSHKVFIEDWFFERQNSVKFLAELDAVRNSQIDEIKTIFQKFNDSHPDISAVVMTDPDGNTVVDTSSDIVVNVSDREYFIQGRTGNPHVSKVIIGRTSGKAIIIFAHPITRTDGTFAGVVFLPAQLTAINNLMSFLHFGKTGETYIVNREGFMLTESRYLDDLKEQHRVDTTAIMTIKLDNEVLINAMRGQQPTGPYKDYRGIPVLGASQWTKDGSWLIISEMDYAEVIGQIYPFLWTILGGSALALLLLTPIIIRLVNSIEVPLHRMSDIAKRMTHGDFDQTCSTTGVIKPPVEIGNLFDAFCAMQEKVESTVLELEQSAVTDQLTQLPNRRYLMQEGARVVDIAIRAKQPCTVFMMDIDHFKLINDTYGHAVGDIVLKQMAEVFRENMRASDIVARFGGEEFAVVAPGSDLQSSQILAERIRSGVESRVFNTEKQPLSCTISIGIAHYSKEIEYGIGSYEDMLGRADTALYAAKAAGRNTVIVAAPGNDEQID